MTADAEDRTEMFNARTEGSEQYSQEQVLGASNAAVTTEYSLDGLMRVMDAVVERENMRAAYSRGW